MPPLDSKQCVCQTIRAAPKGSKLLRSENRGAGGVFCVFGVFRKPLEFVKVAKSLWHPFDTMVQLPDLLLKAIFEQLTLSPLELSKIRLERLSKWRQWSVELQQEEQQARAKMHPNVRKVLGQKRTVLLERIAESLNWPDKSLCNEMRSGFRLVGNATPSNVFRPGVTVANLSEQDLMEEARYLRPAILSRVAAEN